MSDIQDTDKLEAVVDRGADLVELIVERLSDGWQPFTDGPAIAAFFLQKETREALASYKEVGAEAKDLKPYEVAGLIEIAARRAKEQLKRSHNANPEGDGVGITISDTDS